MVILVVLVLLSFFWLPYDANSMNGAEKFALPSWKHIMGTDNYGRDIFSRVCEGLRVTFIVAVSTVLIGLAAGILVGAFTGFFGGIADEILMRLNDALASFPSILLALIFVSIVGSGI